MRAELVLSPPERRIGQTAHDFVSALGAPGAILSRAKKRGGAPTVASRFLQRLEAFAGETAMAELQARGEPYLDLARRLDRAEAQAPAARPQPRPPLALRPTQLSVTRIETLRRDPYAIYAERILRLIPLSPVGAEPGPREIGTMWHAALENFARSVQAQETPRERRLRLRTEARQAFAPLLADAGFRALRWPRIAEALGRFLDFDAARREAASAIHIECAGAVDLAIPGAPVFRLTARADRIELMEGGGAAIIDYKTGAPPGHKEVAVGFAPQLTLEAAMLASGRLRGSAGDVGRGADLFQARRGTRAARRRRSSRRRADPRADRRGAFRRRQGDARPVREARDALCPAPVPQISRTRIGLRPSRPCARLGGRRRGGRGMSSAKPKREVDPRTRALQARASDPNLSAWVTANAGSGKTHVLTQRVIRLLLDRVPPRKILCLTFTKAAAANMSTRVFRTLAGWTTLSDEALARAIRATGAERVEPGALAFARALFARTIETPGGLKIQTIHAFCERLLHLFPFEANVPAGFRVLDDREAGDLLKQARSDAIAEAESDTALKDAIEGIARVAGADGFDDLLDDVLKTRSEIASYGGADAFRERLRVEARIGRGRDGSGTEASHAG